MSRSCNVLAALEFFRVIRSVAGEEDSYVTRIGEDGVIYCCIHEHSGHTEGMPISSKTITGCIVIGVIVVVLAVFKMCVHGCCREETRRNSHRSTVQRVSQQSIQQIVPNLQQPVTPMASATVQGVSQQPILLNVHNLQQPVAPLASDYVVSHPERPTAPPCQDTDPPPPYEVAVACESYNKQVPYNSAYKQ